MKNKRIVNQNKFRVAQISISVSFCNALMRQLCQGSDSLSQNIAICRI